MDFLPVKKIGKWLEPESLALMALWAREGLSDTRIAGATADVVADESAQKGGE